MHLFFGKKQREKRMERTDAQVQAILAPADEQVAIADEAVRKVNNLLEQVKARPADFAPKLYLAMNRGEK